MRKKETIIKNMYSAVKSVLNFFIALWTGYTSFEDAVAKFFSNITKIENAAQIQEMLLKGFTITKRNKKSKMCNRALTVSQKIRAFAASVHDTSLFGRMKFSFSSLFRKRDQVSLTRAQGVLTAANEMTPAQRTAFKITDAEITALSDAIDEFSAMLSLPRDRKVIRKQNTELLVQLFAETSGLLRDQIDNIMSEYKLSNPDFYEQYQNARILVDSIRHTTIEGNVTDNIGIDLTKVKVTLTGKNKETQEVITVFEEMTDKDGNFKKGELNPELEWNASFVLPEHETVHVDDMELKAGEHKNLDVKMNKVI